MTVGQQVRRLVSAHDRIAEQIGRLEDRVPGLPTEELRQKLAQLAAALDHMIDELKDIVGEVETGPESRKDWEPR